MKPPTLALTLAIVVWLHLACAISSMAQSDTVISREVAVKTSEQWDGVGAPISREVTVRTNESWDGIGEPTSREVSVKVDEPWDGIGALVTRELTVNTQTPADFSTVSRELTICAPVYTQSELAVALRIAAGLHAADGPLYRRYNVFAIAPSTSSVDILDVLRLAVLANTPAIACDQ